MTKKTEEAPNADIELDLDYLIGEAHNMPKAKRFPAKVQKVLSDFKVVINRGSMHGIKRGQRFLVYNQSNEEIRDIDTEESLGFLEIVRGTGRITHVQEKIATLESDMKIETGKRITKSVPLSTTHWVTWKLTGPDEIIEDITNEIKPFDDVQKGDFVKPI
jgi:hypothetical protein